MWLINFFKKQNLAIKVGFVSLAISLLVLLLALILISTANFVAEDSGQLPDSSLVGNGWNIMSKFGIGTILSPSGYYDMHRQYVDIYHFTSAPLAQLVSGVVFLVICLPIFGGVGVIALTGGYFKKWLYT